jgi:hypothetical protein
MLAALGGQRKLIVTPPCRAADATTSQVRDLGALAVVEASVRTPSDV